MGNLSKSKNKLYICDTFVTSCVHVRNLHPRANVHLGANLPNLHSGAFSLNTVYMAKIHPGETYTPGVYLHRGVYCAYKRGLTLVSISH